jgi:hypothetical protein
MITTGITGSVINVLFFQEGRLLLILYQTI